MRKRNRKDKMMRLVGMLVVGLAAGGLPAEPVSAVNGWEIDLKNYGETQSASSISISIGGGDSEVLNADKGIAQGMIKQTANVEFGATNGYTVKISGTPNLTGVSTKATIPSAALTLGNMVNQWGWYAVNGVADCSETNVYKAMTSAGTQIDSGVLADGGTKTYTMCFGMRVNGNQAADTYNGSVTVSAVAEPGTVRTSAFSGITYMQDMTANICKLADENETAQLIDRRDNKKYWVTKLLDGNCWMSQNLALDLSTSKALTSADSDVVSSWTPGHDTDSTPEAGVEDNTETYIWNFGDYIIRNPATASDCGGNSAGLSGCWGQFMAVGSRMASTDPNFYKNNGNKTYTDTEYDAHYLAGNYYQWNAATAGTGGTITDANASGSICPKNWKLPSSGNNATRGTFGHMLSQYGVASSLTSTSSVDGNAYNIVLSPLFFVRSGWVTPGVGIYRSGDRGTYWSFAAPSSVDNAYSLYFYGSYVYPSYSFARSDGHSLRCVFLTPNE